MSRVGFQIIPAQLMTSAVYQEEDELFVGEPIIAWRIETHEIRPFHPGDPTSELSSEAYAISLGGEASANIYGVLNPDGTITNNVGEQFASIAEARSEHARSWASTAAFRTASEVSKCGAIPVDWTQDITP